MRRASNSRRCSSGTLSNLGRSADDHVLSLQHQGRVVHAKLHVGFRIPGEDRSDLSHGSRGISLRSCDDRLPGQSGASSRGELKRCWNRASNLHEVGLVMNPMNRVILSSRSLGGGEAQDFEVTVLLKNRLPSAKSQG